jgi:polyhydroxybutyrate depolymerase
MDVPLALLLLLSLVAACSGGDGGAASSGGEGRDGDVSAGSTEPPDCSPARPGSDLAGSAGTASTAGGAPSAQTFTFDGDRRQYLLAIPPEDDGTRHLGLIFDFHGHGGSMADHAADTGMAAEGTGRGYVVVTPQALGDPARWNFTDAADQPDDFGFVDALVTDLSRRLCIDEDRVFVAGHSNGSAFAAFLACRYPYEIAGVAMVSATTPVTCPDGIAPAALAVHGTADPIVAYEGGGRRNLPPAPEIMAGWAEHHGCSPVPVADTAATAAGVERSIWDGCLEGSEIVLDAVDGGRHAWPGSQQAANAAGNSEAGRTFPATTEILDFFDRHSLGGP